MQRRQVIFKMFISGTTHNNGISFISIQCTVVYHPRKHNAQQQVFVPRTDVLIQSLSSIKEGLPLIIMEMDSSMF